MSPQSHTVQVTVLGLNGITLTGTNTREAAVETSAIVSFSRKKSIHASVPSCNLINVGEDRDQSDIRGKVHNSRYMTIWKYDDDTMTDGCLITFQTKLHKKKGTAGFETRSFDVNVGLIQGSESISLGTSLLNITGPVHGMQFDLPIRSLDAVSSKNEKNIFGRNGNGCTAPGTSVRFTSDSKTSFGLDSDASLRIHVAIMLTKHFDEKEKAKALHRSLLLNQMNMVAANYHSQPIVIDALSTDSPLSSISHTIYTNDMSTQFEDRSNSTRRSNKSKQLPNQGISSNRLKQVPPLSENRLLVNQGMPTTNLLNSEPKHNSTYHSKRPPLPVNPSLKHLNDEKVTVSTHASTSTNQDSISEDESNSNNKKKTFSLKKAISRFSPKHVSCAGPQEVALQRQDIIIPPDLDNNSSSSKTIRSLQPHDRSVHSDLENNSSSTSRTNHDYRQKSPASYHSLRNVQHNSTPSHQMHNREFNNNTPSGRSRDYSQDSRRTNFSSENVESRNPPITHNLGGARTGQEMLQSLRRQSLQNLTDHNVNNNRNQHQHTDIRDNAIGLTEQQYVDTNILLQRQLTSMKIESRQNEIDMRPNPVIPNDGMSNRSPARDGCVSVISGPSMPGVLEEENHPYQFNQISKLPNRVHKKVSSDTSENGLYDMLKSGLMCQTTQPGQCLGSKNPKDAISPSPKFGGPPMVIDVNHDGASVGDLTSITIEKEQQKFLSSRMVPAAFGGDGMCTAQNVRNYNYSNRHKPRTIEEEYRNLGEGGIFHNQYVPEMKRTIGKPPGYQSNRQQEERHHQSNWRNNNAYRSASSGSADSHCSPTGFIEEKYRRRRPPTPHYAKQGNVKHRDDNSWRRNNTNSEGYDSTSSYSDHDDNLVRKHKIRNR